jgi:hypothetical protein
MEPNEKLPGLTFHVESSSLQKKHGRVQLDATVNDIDLWEEVLKKLDGFRVYTVADLHTALVEVLQDDQKQMKEEHDHEVQQMRQELERLRQRCSVLEKYEREAAQMEMELAKLRHHGLTYT